MRRSEVLQGIREMRFHSVHEQWTEGGLSQIEAAAALGMTERTFRRWCRRYREEDTKRQRDNPIPIYIS